MNLKYNEITLFNPEVKEEFLSVYPDRTSATYNRIFIFSQPIEIKYNKDLYDFNIIELKELLHSLNASTPAASRTNGRIIRTYWDFAVDQKLRTTGINPLKNYPPDWYDQFAIGEKLYLTEKELLGIENDSSNFQDLVIFRLLWEGVQGKECAEICNLTKYDIDEDHNTLHLTDYDGSKRELVVSDRCLWAINGALREQEYKKRNGELENPKGNLKDYVDLVQNDFVIRNTLTRTINFKSINPHTIYRRINTIREYYGEDYPHLTAKNIARSGMIKMAKDLLDDPRHGKLEKEELELIAERYKVKSINTLYDFVNLDMIQNMYPN